MKSLEITSPDEPELFYERRIINLLSHRILGVGYQQYGEMTCNMEIDHIQECLEEIADALVYIAMQMMKLQRKRDEAEKADGGRDKQIELQQGEDDLQIPSCQCRTAPGLGE